MAKFRVHIFEECRSTYETEAETKEEALRKVLKNVDNLDPIHSEMTGDMSDDVCVDPLLPDGKVDYENYQWFKYSEIKL